MSCFTDVDEIAAPDPRHCNLGEYIGQFSQDFATCRECEFLDMRESEPPFDHAKPVLTQNSTWFNPAHSKPLLARLPLVWDGGFHE